MSVGCQLQTPCLWEIKHRLTPQPFPPKLRLTNRMPITYSRYQLVAVLLGVIFLAAQFHFCADVTSSPCGSHICPVCSTAGSAVASQSPRIAMVPIANRLVVFTTIFAVSPDLPRAISPRAPPAL
jgi:hypothetical protein